MSKDNNVFKSLESLGFETHGSYSCGSYKGYAMDFRLENSYYYLDVAVRVEAKSKELKNALKTAVKNTGLKFSFYTNQGSFLSFLTRFNRKSAYEEQAAAFMDAVVNILRGMNIQPANTCAVCGGGSPDSLCCVSSYQPVHSACMKRMHEEAKDSAEHNRQNGSYLTGFIGAFLGAIVGLLPNIFTAFAFDTLYAVLFALVPMASIWGYKKLNGKNTKGAIVIVVILSLLSVFLLQFLILGSAVADEYGVGFGEAMLAVVEIFLNLEGLVMIASESLTEFFFMLLGLLFSWEYISRTNTTELKASQAVLDTLRPNPAYTQQFESESENTVSTDI